MYAAWRNGAVPKYNKSRGHFNLSSGVAHETMASSVQYLESAG